MAKVFLDDERSEVFLVKMTFAEGLKLFGAVGLLVAGQVLWKAGLTEIGTFSLSADPGGSVAKVLMNAKILAGLVLYAVSLLVYFDVLAKLPLSLVYPFMSLSYAFTMVPAYFILGETISWLRIISIFVIWVGILLLVKS